MKVPTADYSPIERANQSKYDALKASYAAKDAANWKIRDEHAEKGFSLQQRSLDLNTYSTTVSAVALGLSTAVGIGEGLYNLKKQHDQEEAQHWLDTQGAEGFAAAQEQDTTAGGQVDAEVDQWHDEEGNPLTGDDGSLNGAGKGPEAEQPPSAVDQWQEEAFRQIDGQKWTKGTKEWAKRQVERQVSGLAVEKIQQRITEYETQSAQLYQANWQTAYDKTVTSGGRVTYSSLSSGAQAAGYGSVADYICASPEEAWAKLEEVDTSALDEQVLRHYGADPSNGQGMAFTAPFLEQNRQAVREGTRQAVLNQVLDTEGYEAASRAVDTLPDSYSDEEREEIKKGLRTRQSTAEKNATAEGTAMAQEAVKAGKTGGQDYAAAMAAFDAKGLNAAATEAGKEAYASAMLPTLTETIEARVEACLRREENSTKTSMEQLQDLLDEMEGWEWFEGGYISKDAAMTYARTAYNGEVTKWGDNCTAGLQQAWDYYMGEAQDGKMPVSAALAAVKAYAEDAGNRDAAAFVGLNLPALFNGMLNAVLEEKRDYLEDQGYMASLEQIYEAAFSVDFSRGEYTGKEEYTEEMLNHQERLARAQSGFVQYLLDLKGPVTQEAVTDYLLRCARLWEEEEKSFSKYWAATDPQEIPTDLKGVAASLAWLAGRPDLWTVRRGDDGFDTIDISDTRAKDMFGALVRRVGSEGTSSEKNGAGIQEGAVFKVYEDSKGNTQLQMYFRKEGEDEFTMRWDSAHPEDGFVDTSPSPEPSPEPSPGPSPEPSPGPLPEPSPGPGEEGFAFGQAEAPAGFADAVYRPGATGSVDLDAVDYEELNALVGQDLEGDALVDRLGAWLYEPADAPGLAAGLEEWRSANAGKGSSEGEIPQAAEHGIGGEEGGSDESEGRAEDVRRIISEASSQNGFHPAKAAPYLTEEDVPLIEQVFKEEGLGEDVIRGRIAGIRLQWER